MPEMNLEWRDWVEENILRGVAEQDLIRILTENDFEQFTIHSTINEIAARYRYDRLAQAPSEPSTVSNFKPIREFQQQGASSQQKPWVLSMAMDQPILRVYHNVLTPEECEQLMALSRPKLALSTTVNNETGDAVPHVDRSSHGTFFTLRENDFIRSIDERASEIMNLPVERGEGLQVLCYRKGGEYKPHFDYFPPEHAGSHVHIKRGGQRVSTLIFYLNTVEEGGETIFPSAHVKVSPIQGSAVYFSYFDEQRQVDPLTLHGGMPVIRGEKWISTKWMREYAQ
jgi:prolyl 4-hydroxylase